MSAVNTYKFIFSRGRGQRGRRREPGKDTFLILRAGFKQLCIMTVGLSETLHAGTWLGGEQSADAWMQTECCYAGGPGP